MRLFYAEEVNEKFAFLDQDETRHCMKTLRMKPGDSIVFTDGLGMLFKGVLGPETKKRCQITIQSADNSGVSASSYLYLAIAPTKNISRIEWLLEKTTELGIRKIDLMLCRYSERKKVREDRLRKIIVSASKQSLQTLFPVLTPLDSFEHVVQQYSQFSYKFIAHCHADDLPHFKSVVSPGENTCILIGPEGDFSLKEVELAEKNGFISVGLGAKRLRTETAGLYACSIVNMINT